MAGILQKSAFDYSRSTRSTHKGKSNQNIVSPEASRNLRARPEPHHHHQQDDTNEDCIDDEKSRSPRLDLCVIMCWGYSKLGHGVK